MKEYTFDLLKKACENEECQAFLQMVKKEYEQSFEGKPIVRPSYLKYKRIEIDGNRKEYETEYFSLRIRLACLEVLVLTDDKYLDDFEETLSAICDSFTWVLPAHAYLGKGEYDYERVDLFSAETAFYLAEAAVVFKDKITPDLYKRIYTSVEQKAIAFIGGKGNWWKECGNNWASVCAGSLGCAYLYLFPERYQEVATLVDGCMERFLGGFDDDGVCLEGISYWQYGFFFFALFYDVYQKRTGIRAEILDLPKVKKILKYAVNARLAGDIYLPFADGGTSSFVPRAEVIYTVKNLFGADMPIPQMSFKVTGTALLFRVLEGISEYGTKEDTVALEEFVYYPKCEVYIRRKGEFIFTAKGGHNNEFHNHNDVGAFELLYKGKRVITDIGSGEYTWEYFNARGENGRYGKKIFVCSSLSHSVPLVDGQEQVEGNAFKGEVLVANEEEFALDIARAYQNPVDKLEVSYKLKESGLRVAYKTAGVKEKIAFCFVYENEPTIKDGVVEINGVKLTASKNLPVGVCAWTYSTHAAEENTAYVVEFTATADEAREVEFFFKA